MSINELLVSLLITVSPVEIDDKLVINEFLNKEAVCLTQNVYHEARNQPQAGQMAVMSVTLNRVKDSRFPNTICGVVKQGPHRPSWKGTGELIPVRHRCQFSWYCDGKSDQPKDLKGYKKATDVAIQVYSGTIPDVTEGALWYHATYIRKPFWAYSFQETVKINEHIFYKRPGR